MIDRICAAALDHEVKCCDRPKERVLETIPVAEISSAPRMVDRREDEEDENHQRRRAGQQADRELGSRDEYRERRYARPEAARSISRCFHFGNHVRKARHPARCREHAEACTQAVGKQHESDGSTERRIHQGREPLVGGSYVWHRR